MEKSKFKKKILIHVGPPKTGTTSLQHWLHNHENVDFFYLGIKPNRFDRKNELVNLFYKHIKGKISIQDLIKKMDNATNLNTLLISEELLIHGDNWKDCINSLAKLKEHYNVKIAYCYRNSIKTIPSIYAESHSNLSEDLKQSFSKFINSKLVEAYKLDIVQKTFDDMKLDYNIFDFNELIKSELTINSIFNIDTDISVFKKKIKLPSENITQKNKYFYNAKVKTPKQMIFEKKIRKISNKYFNKDLSKYFTRTYKIKIEPNQALEELSLNNQKIWKNING